jgi:HEAT repeat protein
MRVFRIYGWPAIEAALDNPGYPQDPAVRWRRTFPKIPRGPRFDDEAAAAQRSRAELEEVMERADSDPRAFQGLLARLETDPDPAIRQGAAWWLLDRASEERSRQALRAAAAEDENVEVRWIARYALRLH